MCPPSVKVVWAVLWFIAIVSTAVFLSYDVRAADVWTVHHHGAHTVIVGPNGQRHTIVDNTPPVYGYYGQSQGWNQYPNPVDSFMTNFRRGAEWGSWLRQSTQK